MFGDAIIENEDIATQVINDDTFYIPDSAAATEIQPGNSADLKSFDFVDNVSSDSVSSNSVSSDSASSASASSDDSVKYHFEKQLLNKRKQFSNRRNAGKKFRL